MEEETETYKDVTQKRWHSLVMWQRINYTPLELFNALLYTNHWKRKINLPKMLEEQVLVICKQKIIY